jgi:hypothetical protein
LPLAYAGRGVGDAVSPGSIVHVIPEGTIFLKGKIVGVTALSLFYSGRRALPEGAAYAWEYAVIDGVSGKARTYFREW